MVEIYQPLKRQKDNRWDYTHSNSRESYPLGYCAGYRVYEVSDYLNPETVARLNAKYEPLKDNFHNDGHATAEEAVACWHKYLLDTQLTFSERPDEKEQHRCAICNEWTQHAGWIHGEHQYFWRLCPAHQNRLSVEWLMEQPRR